MSADAQSNGPITDPGLGTEDFQDELLSINAIYGDDTLAHVSNTAYFSLKIAVPGLVSTSRTVAAEPKPEAVVLKLSIPLQYPSVPPRIVSLLSLGDSQALKGRGKEIVDAATELLNNAFQPQSPVIADLIDGLATILSDLLHAATQASAHEALPLQDQERQESQEPQRQPSSPAPALADPTRPGPAWVLSDPITERKSVFVARLVRVRSVGEAKQSLAHLLQTDRKVARATHNISAWRIRGPGAGVGPGPGAGAGAGDARGGGGGGGGVSYQDCDDDGETAAGGRLLHLLQLTDVWGVMVVVSRWYGGVHLGPARFKLINSAAREVLVKAGLVEAPAAGGS